MRGGRMIEQLFLHSEPVEAGHRAQAAGDGGSSPPAGFQITCEELDVSPAGAEQLELVLLAPAGELPQVQLIRLPGQAAVSSQEPS